MSAASFSATSIFASLRIPHAFRVCTCAWLLGVFAFAGCSREIGDGCNTALDCSASGTRLCDNTQPGGYCTLANCQENTCPSESECVKFWPKVSRPADIDRLSMTYCMYKCDERSDCRGGYDCFTDLNFGAMGEAEVLGNRNQKFCAPLPTLRAYALDAGSLDAALGDDAGAEVNMSIAP
jgi:hypothetical protein